MNCGLVQTFDSVAMIDLLSVIFSAFEVRYTHISNPNRGSCLGGGCHCSGQCRILVLLTEIIEFLHTGAISKASIPEVRHTIRRYRETKRLESVYQMPDQISGAELQQFLRAVTEAFRSRLEHVIPRDLQRQFDPQS